jgi:hypothetical protein
MRRPLADTLLDALGAVSPPPTEAVSLRVTAVDLDLPVEIALLPVGSETVLLADLPRWRWTTGFDAPRNRLRVACRPEEAP